MKPTPDPLSYQLHRETLVPRPLPEVFAFFAAPANLDALTPPWLHFALHSMPPRMRAGVEIDYRVRLRRLPMRWTSLISSWEPPHRFVDEQVRGPYRRWVHEHRFEAVAGGTRVIDHVDYQVPGGPLLGRLVHRFLVAPDVATIFDYRQRRLRELLGPDTPVAALAEEPAA